MKLYTLTDEHRAQTLMPQSLLTRVTRILREQTFGPHGDIHPSTRLDQLDASIFFPVCVTCALDEEFGIELPDDAIKATDTVADVIASVGALVGEVARG